jgi:Tol biopolymer transport system component
MFGNVAPSAIVLMPADGGEASEITNDNAQNLSPSWSPDSSRLYFVSNRQGIGDIYSVGVQEDGGVHGEPARITTGLGVQSMSFSADMKRLLYSAYSARANVWSMPIPSEGTVNISAATPLTSGNQIIEAMKLSPDGKWLFYDSTLHGSADIFRMPAGGGAVERLTSHPSHEFAPAVSPDGRLLAYHSFRTGTRDVFVQPLDGGRVEQVTNTPAQESFPTWLRDSQGLLFFDQAVAGGKFRGQFLTRRHAPGTWEPPRDAGFEGLSRYSMLPDGPLAYPFAGGVEVSTLDRTHRRVIYLPAPGSGAPRDKRADAAWSWPYAVLEVSRRPKGALLSGRCG